MRAHHLLTRRSIAGAVLAAPLLGAARISAQESTPEAEFRTVTDVYGEVEVPVNPQRVIVLDGPQLDACIALGVKPTGGITAFANAPFPQYLGDETEGIENVGTIAEPNLEQIIALEPDLILGSNLRNEDIHSTLVEIAPTVFSEEVSDDWRGNFLIWADALNKLEAAEEVSAMYDARLEEFKAATESSRADWVISVLRFNSDHVRLYNDTSFIGTILKGADLKRPESQTGADPERGIFTIISPEQINLADGTHMFTCAYGSVDDTTADEFVSTPLWSTLTPVQNDTLYWVEDDFWMVAVGYLAAHKVIDDLFTYLVDGEPGVAIPL